MEEIITNKLFQYFCLYPSREEGIREVARSMNLSHTHIRTLAQPLIKKRLISKRKAGKTLLISINHHSEAFYLYKKWTNLFLLLDSVLEQLSQQNPKTVVLFGSFSRGEDTEESDIDLAISEEIDLTRVEKKMKRKVSCHILSNLRDTALENVRQGIVLWGVMP